MATEEPRQVGNIDLGEVLFRAPPSTFYRGCNRMLGNDVLVRRLHLDSENAEAMRETFFRAQRHAAGLAHPSIFRPMDIVDTGDDLWTVHEFHAMRPTQYVIERRGAAPVAETAHVAAQVADALSYIHRRGFVHGRVSPMEVVVGLDRRAFLISQMKGAELAADRWPLEPDIQGLSPFSSPEELAGERPTPSSDTFSLAATTYYWLTSLYPRGGETPEEALARARACAPIPPLREVRPDIPAALADALRAALHDDPEQRRGSCASLASLLDEIYRHLVAEVPAGFETGSRIPVMGDLDAVQIMGRHGAGAYGVVFRAREPQQGFGFNLAVKALKPEHRQDDEARMRFIREAESIRVIDHPNVVRIRGVGEHGDTPFVVMDFVEGPDLGTILLRSGALGAREAVRLGRGIAEGLAAIHEHGIVHRDLKPHNILVPPDRGPVITDFGVARNRAAPRLTLTGHVVGTPAYMAPEQILGEPVSPATDLYALGAILFELLTGETPFPSRDTISTMRAIREQAPPNLPEDVPPELATLVMKLLSKRPEDRYGDGHAVARALGAIAVAAEEEGGAEELAAEV